MEIQVLEARILKDYRKKVCAYCRVSTDALEQENSLENQIAYYENLIQSNPEYEYAGVYYDFAISGYKEKRPGLQKMLTDARNGKIDLIYTKSVSRFARNTAIVLKASRELKELNVGIFFELQNINTLSSQGELMLTILAAFAQAESESGSIGAKMVYQRKYEQGIPVQYLERCFGYTKNEKGEFVPDTEQAKWIVKIYEMAAEGYSLSTIADEMNAAGVKTDKGAGWVESTVKRILENEIYKGDYIMHKNYVNEERKLVRNRGEVDAWYIEDDHPPIVSRQLWDKAQEARKKKRDYLDMDCQIREVTEENYPYKGHLFCAKCGSLLTHRIYSNGNRMSWDCSGRTRHGKDFCDGIHVPDTAVRQWQFDGNIYISVKDSRKSIKEFSYIKESSWSRRHKKKEFVRDVPELTEENYPYYRSIFCAECGSRLVRHIKKHGDIVWECNGRKRKGAAYCEGVRIPDRVVKAFMPIRKAIYIKERKGRNGTKHYSYSCKKPERAAREEQD